MKRAIILAFPVVLATAFTAAPAFTLNGTVKSESGNPVAGASVKLLSAGETATTDSLGKFEIKKDDLPGENPDGILASGFAPGYISYADGILHFSQSSASPEAERNEIIFPGGVYVGENPSRPANVRVGRQRRTASALQQAANPVEKGASAFFDKLRGCPARAASSAFG